MDELKTLGMIVKSPRLHYKEAEKANFDALRESLELYEAEKNKYSEETVREFMTKKALKTLNEEHSAHQHMEMAKLAKARGVSDHLMNPVKKLKDVANAAKEKNRVIAPFLNSRVSTSGTNIKA